MNDRRGLVRNLADVEAIESTPLSEQYSFTSTFSILEKAAERWGNETALQYLFEPTPKQNPLRFTYGEFLRKVIQTANLFHRLGIGPRDVVAYVLPNMSQTHFVIWGGETAGIVASANPLLEGSQIGQILSSVQARVLVTLAPETALKLWDKISPILPQLSSLKTILQIDLRQFTDASDFPDEPAVRRIGNVDVLNFDREVAKEREDLLVSGRTIRPEDTASYFHTGGTTGMPKIAPHSHGNQVYMAWAMGRARNLVQPGEVSLCGLPLFHVNAVIVSGLANFVAGANVLLAGLQGFRTPELRKHFWKLVERYRVNYFSGVPTIYAALLDVPLDGADVSSLRFGFCGTAPMPPEVFRRFEKTTGVKILEGYGLTEGTATSVVNPPGGERRIGSIGIRYPYQQVKVGIINGEGKLERDARTGEIGVVLIKGPNIFSGYLREQDNKSIWVGDGWLNTGDLGRIDEDGYFWLTGRSKDLIIRGGHNIDPQSIEDTLCRHPSVAMAAAVGQPDGYAGEVPIAYVVVREGVVVTPGELLEFVRGNIGERAAAPVRIEILKQLPVTAVGKIFKPELRHRAVAFVFSTVLQDTGIAAEVFVKADPVSGTLAQVSLQNWDDLERAKDLLNRFTVKCAFTPSTAKPDVTLAGKNAAQ